MFPRYYIGQSILEVPLPEGMYYYYQDQELLLLLVSEGLGSLSTYSTFLFEPAEFALAIQEDLLFFLVRFGSLPWQMSLYDRKDFSVLLPVFSKHVESSSSKFSILLVDSDMGYVQGVRHIGMTEEFAHILYQCMLRQITLPPMKGKQYKQALAQVKKKYPHPENLVLAANVRMIDVPSQSSREIFAEKFLSKQHNPKD